MRRVQGSGMTGCAAGTAERHRLPRASTRAVAAAVAAVVLAAACGSDSDEPADSSPVSSTAAPAQPAAPAAPPPGSAATVPSAGEAAGPVPPEVPSQPAAPPSPTEAANTRPGPPPQPPAQLDTSDLRTFPAPEVWAALRQCQSRGDYRYVHPSGDYFGAYQFTVATWDRLANQRYTHLLGVLPSEAAPADQDRMAYYLWIESGHARWPACSHVFTGGAPSTEPAVPESEPGVPFEPAPGDDEAVPPPSTAAEPVDPGESGVTTTSSPADLPTLEIDPSAQPAVPPDVAGFPTPEQWEAFRFCESSGNYRAVSRDGRYYGAYQFWPDTWDFVARRNYPRLVGMLPSAATTHDQDRMAYRLWEERADQPWPVCGRYLRPGA